MRADGQECEAGSAEGIFEHHFSQVEAPGVSFFFGSGDTGAPGIYPAMSPSVVAVGGTTLRFKAGGKLKSETGWSGSGGGCSFVMTASAVQPAYPQYPNVSCAGKRASPDLSLLGDPATGAAVYTTEPINGHSGWLVLAGTSLSTPMIAARAAGTGQLVNQSYVYGANILFRDIRRGNNGFPCTTGYDLVTGRGSWTE